MPRRCFARPVSGGAVPSICIASACAEPSASRGLASACAAMSLGRTRPPRTEADSRRSRHLPPPRRGTSSSARVRLHARACARVRAAGNATRPARSRSRLRVAPALSRSRPRPCICGLIHEPGQRDSASGQSEGRAAACPDRFMSWSILVSGRLDCVRTKCACETADFAGPEGDPAGAATHRRPRRPGRASPGSGDPAGTRARNRRRRLE